MCEKCLNTNHLKFIAIFCMLIDHLVKIKLIPELLIFIIIGRIAFPIFAYCLAEGLYYTHSKKKYFLIMLLFAFLSEIPFDLNKGYFFYMGHQNVLFTFSIAILTVMIIERIKYKGIKLFVCFCSFILATVYCVDYFGFGVLFVLFLYYLKKNKEKFKNTTYWTFIFLSMTLFSVCFFLFDAIEQIFCLLSIIPLYLYNGEKGKIKIKYLFYLFYPLHLLIIFFIKYYFF